MWHKLFFLVSAGALGTLARYGLHNWVHLKTGSQWFIPLGTLAVNTLGCFLFGLIWSAIGEGRWGVSPQTRLIVLTGFMGAFTTFSTFGFETVQLLQRDQWTAAAINLVVQNVAGLVMVMAGMALGRWSAAVAT